MTEDNSLRIGYVQGNVVISQNQSGGITAHSVTINEIKTPEWSLTKSEKQPDGRWRATLSAKGVGKLAFYNWNILLTLNTPVILREDVPGEVSVGPWIPLSVSGAELNPRQFFIGFLEFKPGQYFCNFLYSDEPLQIERVDSLSG